MFTITCQDHSPSELSIPPYHQQVDKVLQNSSTAAHAASEKQKSNARYVQLSTCRQTQIYGQYRQRKLHTARSNDATITRSQSRTVPVLSPQPTKPRLLVRKCNLPLLREARKLQMLDKSAHPSQHFVYHRLRNSAYLALSTLGSKDKLIVRLSALNAQ